MGGKMRKCYGENREEQDYGQADWDFSREGFMGLGGFARAQFGQRGMLRPMVLKMLEEKPMTGMEIINKFLERSHGWWKPSPGSVYPLLKTLESEGLIIKRDDGSYELTREFASEVQNEEVDDLITNMESTVSYFEDMAKSDMEKFSLYEERIWTIADRLSRLKNLTKE
jgi:DNA-binding PadR family transcriptional regulator